MKKLVVIIVIVLQCNVALGQVLIALVFGEKLQTEKLEFGLVVSPTYSTISNIDAKRRFGMGLGLYFNVKLSQNVFFHPEAVPKAAMGADGIDPYPTGNDSLDVLFADGGSVERKLKAISVPLLMRFRIKGTLFADVGPQIDWLLQGKDIYSNKINDNDVTYTARVDDLFTRFDLGVAGGVEYKLRKDKGMGFGVRYFYGLTDIMTKSPQSQTNQILLFNISIPVGVGKAEANAAKQ